MESQRKPSFGPFPFHFQPRESEILESIFADEMMIFYINGFLEDVRVFNDLDRLASSASTFTPENIVN